MADHSEDEIMRALDHTISLTYSILLGVCGLLPVPIALPADQNVPLAHAVPAIRRAITLAKDQPMGETQEAQLRSGCVYLLAAIDLFAMCAMRYEESRAEGAGANLHHAQKALADLEVWLLINRSD